MERIQKALDQAARERSAGKQAAEPRPETPTVLPTGPEDTFMAASTVQYSRTKVVEVSRDVLEANRLVAALPDHELTDVYRILRTRVLQSMNSNRWNALNCTPRSSKAS